MKIVLDVDEVLRKTSNSILTIYNRENPENKVRFNDIKTWGIGNHFPNIESEEAFFRKHAKEIFLYSGAYERATEFNDSDDYIIIASAQLPGLEKYTEQWLKNNKIRYDELVFTYNKSELGDVLLDDSTHNLKSFKGVAICMDRPWNKDWNGDRVNSIRDFSYICEHIGRKFK